MRQKYNAVADAIAAAGSQAKLAEKLGVTQQTVSGWLGQGFVPASRVWRIEKLYKIPRKSLLNPKIRRVLGTTEKEIG